jgi:hypothetical protein
MGANTAKLGKIQQAGKNCPERFALTAVAALITSND